MAQLNYNEIKEKNVIVFNNEPHVVLSTHVFRKQQRKPVNITKLKSLISGRVVEQTFHQNETALEADLESKLITFIYRKPGEYWFHPVGTPSERFMLPEETVGSAGKYLKERSELKAMVFNDEIIGVQIPIKVDLKVKEAAPAVKGNTSSGATKDVVLETGAPLQVPQFINAGDIVSVNTETESYSERVEKAQ